MKERKIFQRNENEITECKFTWGRMMPHFQTICEEAKLLGLEPSHELITDLIDKKGAKTIENLRQLSLDNIKRMNITDPTIVTQLIGNPGQRIEAMLKAAEMVMYCRTTSFLPNMKWNSFNWSYLSFDEQGNPALTEEAFQQIVDDFFSIWADTEKAQKILELSEKIIPGLTEIFQIVWQNVDVTAQFQNIFSYDRDKKNFVLNPKVIELVDLNIKHKKN